MENSDFSKSLAAIIEKRRNCIPLTNAEEKLVNESLNKLLDAKKCVNKTLSHTTGDEIRKAGSSPVLPKAPSTDPKTEGVPPQDRGKAGGYESKSDVAERQPAQATDAQPVAPVKVDTNLTDKKESTVPAATDKPDPKPYGDKTKEEWADVDNKKFKNEFYEEDKVGRITEHADYPESIKVSSIVVKTVGTRKVVGQVLKVYSTKNGQTGLMVKWSDGRFEHVNQQNVELLKSVVVRPKPKVPGEPEASNTEKGLISSVVIPLVTEAVGVGAGVLGGDLASNAILHPKKPKAPKAPHTPSATEAGKPSGDSMTLKSDDSADTEKSVANATLGAVLGGSVAGAPGAVVGAGVGALTGNKPKVKKSDEVSDTEKVTGALRPDEAIKVADAPLPTEAPDEFIKGVVETLKELTDLSDEEIISVAKSAWQEIAAEQTAKAAAAKDVKKEMYDGQSNVATTPTDRADVDGVGNVLVPKKDVNAKDVKKDAFDEAVSVASPIGQAAVANQGANKCSATPEPKK